jgi:hypothetical protein
MSAGDAIALLGTPFSKEVLRATGTRMPYQYIRKKIGERVGAAEKRRS